MSAKKPTVTWSRVRGPTEAYSSSDLQSDPVLYQFLSLVSVVQLLNVNSCSKLIYYFSQQMK